MDIDLRDLRIFVSVANAKGFRGAARATGVSASVASEALRRLEGELGVRLLHRSTRSVELTEVGERLLERLNPALQEIGNALDVVNMFRDRPTGTLRLNVPVSVAVLVLPPIVSGFLTDYPDIRLEVMAQDSFVDVIAAGCDAGIRYGERLEQDMIAIPIGPRIQSFVTAAAPGYWKRRGRPLHPSELLKHDCIRGRFSGGAMPAWEFERAGETVRVDPGGPLVVSPGGAIDLAIAAAVSGVGVIHLFEEWLQPHLASGALEPVLEDWSETFPGPFLYYPGNRLAPGPLRAFIDYIRSSPGRTSSREGNGA